MSLVVVVGGGPAGAAAACHLASAGQRVTLLERTARPESAVCGEFLSPAAQRHLAALGLDLADLGAQPIDRLRLVRGAHVVETALPFLAQSLPRRTLDAALRARAVELGAKLHMGATVRRWRPDGVLEVGGLGEMAAPVVFLGTGKHDLRGARRQLARAPQDWVGFKQHLVLAPAQSAALDRHVELVLLHDSYIGLQPSSAGRATLCLLAAAGRVRAAGGDWDGLREDLCRASPHLARRLEGAVAAGAPLAIARVPYGHVHVPAPDDPAGLFRLGDQIGVIPSFAGDGIAIALASAASASRAYLAAQARALRPRLAAAMAMQRIGGSAAGQALLMGAARMMPWSVRIAAGMLRAGQAPRS